ncbi:MAG: OmpA family protein [Hyphomonadaceae bacterium]
MKTMSMFVAAVLCTAALTACVSTHEAPTSGPRHYSGVLLQWFEGQSFRADGETEVWAYGMSPAAMQQLARAYPEGYAPRGSHTVIIVDVEGELRPVDPVTHRYGCVGGCYDHYLNISRVNQARLLRTACPPIARQVFFASNESTLDASAIAIIEGAVHEAHQGACNVSQVTLVGHADTVGPAARNVELSRARVDAVQAALVAGGFVDTMMAIEAAGEERLPYRTADNVAEPINRVVQILIESPTAEVF